MPAFISCIVLCEISWVLKSVYKISKKDRIKTLQNILSVAVFNIEQIECCLKALKLYEAGTADFSDYLIQQIAWMQGYKTVLTFEKNALKTSGFKNP